MIPNGSDDEIAAKSGKGRYCRYYQQLGAPTLIYEGSRRDNRRFHVESSKLPLDNSRELHETLKRSNRVKARWQFSLDVNQIDSISIPGYGRGRRKYGSAKLKTNYEDGSGSSGSETEGKMIQRLDKKRQQNRLAMLLEDDAAMARHRKCLEDHAKFEHPYMKANFNRVGGTKEPRIKPSTYLKSQKFSVTQRMNANPSYLAPFDLDCIDKANSGHDTEKNLKGRSTAFRRKIASNTCDGPPQGNALLSVPCPCDSCSKGTKRYMLLHPKGGCLERLCVSSVVLPLDRRNIGDIDTAIIKHRTSMDQSQENFSTSEVGEICLGDTILEIKQCGVWGAENQICIFAIRTGTHISVVNIKCKRLNLEAEQEQDSELSRCCGWYTLKEMERLDLRSFSPKIPSFRPVSLASHPKYGSAFTPSRFAFASHSEGSSGSSSYNVVHSCTFGTERTITNRHDINNLRSISFIDFSNRNPMCLWSAASSYVRPALALGPVSKVTRQAKAPFGLGSSLFMIDLRSNSAVFQWSPSAEEMMTEGVHSINGISTDWTQENTVFVTSTSAGKTWEIDGRMPCRAVNAWSLTSICEEYRAITLPKKAFYGEASLLTRPLTQFGSSDLPLLKVDTDLRATGIHLFQKPVRKPRFQTDSLECIGTAGLDVTETASIATSSFFDLTGVSDDTFTCGISSIRVPLSLYVDADENIWPQYLKENLNVLSTMTIDNNGDIYSHSLLECNDKVELPDECRRFDGLPIGTRAINIPKKIDGRTKFLLNGHWKQTGGMNLNLFLSNVYPVCRNAILSNGDDAGDINGHDVGNSNKILLNTSKKKKIDEGNAVVQITKKPRKTGLIIRTEDNNGNCNGMIEPGGDDRTLIMPLSHSKGIESKTVVYPASNNSNDSDGSDGTVVIGMDGNGSKSRSDLSKDIIKNTLDTWEDTASEQDSLDEKDCISY